MKIVLIRHGETAGNLEKRYVGKRTDEGLTEEAKEKLSKAVRENGEGIFARCAPVREILVSPMKRCRETKEILFPAVRYPKCPVTAVPGLSECDFGRFEYKNYRDLNGDADYQRFIDSGGTEGFPGGETTQQFKKRCAETFGELIFCRMEKGLSKDGSLVFVIHGGTIMAVLEAFSKPHGDYYSFQVKNGCGYVCRAVRDPGMPYGFHLTDIAKVSVL